MGLFERRIAGRTKCSILGAVVGVLVQPNRLTIKLTPHIHRANYPKLYLCANPCSVASTNRPYDLILLFTVAHPVHFWCPRGAAFHLCPNLQKLLLGKREERRGNKFSANNAKQSEIKHKRHISPKQKFVETYTMNTISTCKICF